MFSTLYADLTDKALPYTEDSGWIELTLSSGASAASYGSQSTPSIRKIGKFVYLVGSVAISDFSGTTFTFASIPSGYRPKRNTYFNPQTGNLRVCQIAVSSSSGSLWVDYVIDLESGTRVTGDISWICLDGVFWCTD